MSLQDKDRIFTNLYGFQDWGLKAAQQRGAWDDTQALIARGPDSIIYEMKDSGLRPIIALVSFQSTRFCPARTPPAFDP